MKRLYSGFEAPVYGVAVPKDYKTEVIDGIVYLVPPKGANVPDELKCYVKGDNHHGKQDVRHTDR